MPGVLYFGRLYEVPGLKVISPGDEPWAKMDGSDYARRDTPWIRQITIHTTKGTWPQLIRPGVGPVGRARDTAMFWSTSSVPGGAPFVIGSGGEVACLVDIGKYQTYHATTVNPWSVGIEMYQEADGSIYDVVLDNCVKLVVFLCDLLGVPLQGSGRIYHEDGILQRMLHGGPDVVGVYGHRDNAWQFPEWMDAPTRARYPNGTSSRGKGDPGEEIFIRLNKAGKLNFDIDNHGEMMFWKVIQNQLNAQTWIKTKLNIDGICGPGTVAALKGFNLWERGLPVRCPVTEPAFKLLETSTPVA
jgi:N-acetylmuramoyl-L-alanine amidase